MQCIPGSTRPRVRSAAFRAAQGSRASPPPKLPTSRPHFLPSSPWALDATIPPFSSASGPCRLISLGVPAPPSTSSSAGDPGPSCPPRAASFPHPFKGLAPALSPLCLLPPAHEQAAHPLAARSLAVTTHLCRWPCCHHLPTLPQTCLVKPTDLRLPDPAASVLHPHVLSGHLILSVTW